MKKRIAAFLLAAITALSLAACATDPSGGNSPANDTTAPADTTAAPAESTLPPETEITPDLPDVGDKYKGTELVICNRGTGHAHYNEPWIYAESINGDTINDAVFKRNSYIEEKYGVKIVNMQADSPQDQVTLAANSMDDMFDIAYPRVQYITNQALKGMLYNLHELEYINFDMPWWDSNLVERQTYAGNLFVGVSDISLSVTNNCRGMIFNRDLIREYEVEDPYDLVKNNEWTLEKCLGLIQEVNEDADGDTAYTDADIYGMLTEMGGGNGNVNQMLIGAGTRIFDVDNEGNISVSFMNEKTIDILTLLKTVLTDNTMTRSYGALGSDPAGADMYNYGRRLFAEGHFLFYQGSTSTFNELVAANMEDEYGIVPLPKYNPEQEGYYHRPDRNCAVLVIPKTNDEADLERLAILLEDMSYMSSKTVVPDYYETVIKLRRARVPELGEMVDLIKNNIYYDIAFLYTISYTDAIDASFNSGNFSSTFERQNTLITRNLQNLKKQLDQLG